MENLGNEFTCYEFVSNLEENEIEDLREYLSSNILTE